MKKITIKLLMLTSAFSVFTVISGGAAYASSVDKVVICHIPPGNPDNMHSIKIGEPAVDAHLAHGDYLSYCWGETEASDHHDEAAAIAATTAARPVHAYSLRSIHGG